MAKKTFTTEQIICKLREVEVLLSADCVAGNPLWALWLTADHGAVAGGWLESQPQESRASLAHRRAEIAAETALSRPVVAEWRFVCALAA